MATNKTTIFNNGIKQFQRPSTATSISYKSYQNFLAYPTGYRISSTSGTNPSSNGDLSIDSTNPTNVAFIEVRDNSGNGTNNSTFLNNIARGSQIRIQQPSTGQDITYDVLFVTDFTGYTSFQVVYNGGYVSGAFNTSGTITTYFYADYQHELDHGYNLLSVTNTATSNPLGNNFRMIMPSNMEAGEEIVVELLAGSSTTNNVIPSYVYCLNDPTGTVASDFSDESLMYTPNGTSANALITLDSNDRAVMKFVSWYNTSLQNGLIFLGGQQVING